MGLVLRYVVTTQAGTKHYRRRLPKEVAVAIGKGEFKRLLGENDREALKAYPRVHAEFEKLVAATTARIKLAKLEASLSPTNLEIHKRAVERSRELATVEVYLGETKLLAGEDSEAADILREEYFSRFPVDPETGNPVGADAIEGRAMAMLAGGRFKRPSPTLEDARKLYLNDRVGTDRKKVSELERIFALMREALQKDRTLASLRREDAREVRDHILEGRTPATVDRYLNVVRAALNHAIREFDLTGVVNPFMSLEAAPGRAAEDPDREKRRSFSSEELDATTARVLSRGNFQLRSIWQMLVGTGCRLAEITGLRTSDVHLSHAIPHIVVAWHDGRRIKTKVSRRRIPLFGDALTGAQRAVEEAGGRLMLFPAYGREGGPDAASAALGKHVRACVTDSKVTTHSLRHTMKDRLRLASVSKEDQDIVLGHASGSVGEDYGWNEVRLQVAERALKAALGVKLA